MGSDKLVFIHDDYNRDMVMLLKTSRKSHAPGIDTYEQSRQSLQEESRLVMLKADSSKVS